VRTALAFLTRLPVPSPPDPNLNRAAAYFPLVGLLVGAAAAGTRAAADQVLPPLPATLLAIAVAILLTGALHEDGLADVADGFGGGATRDDKLRIMHDSRIGSYGALALVLAVLARAGAIAGLADPAAGGAALVAAGAVSRAALPVAMTVLAPARADGLATAAGRPHPLRAAAAVLIAILIALALLGEVAIGALVAGVAGALAVLLLARRQIGGHTGDVLGAVQQLTEIGVLFGAVAAR
jgi:adenosylcobinamide-GDP ribazoletransferase